MNIEQLIAKLQQIRETHGNLPVVLDDENFYPASLDVTGAPVVNRSGDEKGEKVVVLRA